MRKYMLLSMGIVVVSLLVSVNIIIAAYNQYSEFSKDQNILQERKSVPVNALDPGTISTTKIFSGELIIPKLGLDCTIRSDTVNAYNAVYRYPESVYPGQPGECGLLGHRTTYSGPFENLGSLKPGDEVIIKDLNKRKKYVYTVTSNGDDIRWDYKTNPVRFAQKGEARLLLMTCYPPGQKEAAYITHCKLVSSSSY